MITSPLTILLTVASITAGLLLIFMGRRLTWFFAGTVGYLFGAEAGSRIAGPGAHGLVWTVALGLGVLGVLATLAQPRAAALFASCLAGGVLILRGAAEFSLTLPAAAGLFLLGAVLAGLATVMMFDQGIIALTVLIGSMLAVGALPLEGIAVPVAWAFLLFTGIAIQWNTSRLDEFGISGRRPPRSIHPVGILSK